MTAVTGAEIRDVSDSDVGIITRDESRRRPIRRWVAAGAAISVLLRLPMFWTPVSVDEGAYLAIARSWAHGKVLYRDVWVDRPQGLLLLFRLWDWVSGGSTSSIRILAMIFGVLLVVATSVAVAELVSPAAGGWTAIVCAIASSSPVLEAYSANGELLSGAVSAAAIAVAAMGWRRPRRLRWFFAAGILAGVALSLKQSGFDGLFAVGSALFAAVLVARGRRVAMLRALGALAAGLACVLAAIMIHAALTGWSRWWTAVVGYRLSVDSAVSAPRWLNLVTTSIFAAVVLGTSALAACVGATLLIVDAHRRRTDIDRSLVLLLWLPMSIVAFFLGGGFWRHYWMLLAAPISALAGVALARAGKLKPVVLLALLLPALAMASWVYHGDYGTIAVRSSSDRRSVVDRDVARWFRRNRQTGDNLYALCSSAGVYADAHQDPGYPYLWMTEVRHAPQSQQLLVSYLSDPLRSPRFIAEYQSAGACDSSGRVKTILHDNYHKVTTIDRVEILGRNAIPAHKH